MTPTPLHHTQSIHQDMETIPYDSRERISSEVRLSHFTPSRVLPLLISIPSIHLYHIIIPESRTSFLSSPAGPVS